MASAPGILLLVNSAGGSRVSLGLASVCTNRIPSPSAAVSSASDGWRTTVRSCCDWLINFMNISSFFATSIKLQYISIEANFNSWVCAMRSYISSEWPKFIFSLYVFFERCIVEVILLCSSAFPITFETFTPKEISIPTYAGSIFLSLRFRSYLKSIPEPFAHYSLMLLTASVPVNL